MKLAFITDLHIGNHAKFGAGPLTRGLNVRCVDTLETIRRASAMASQLGCTHMSVGGDVFDYDRVEPALEAAMLEVIQDSGMHWHLLVGNHDQTSDQPNHHAVAPLRGERATVYESPTHRILDNMALFAVPFQSGRAEDWLEKSMIAAGVGSLPASRCFRVMMVHLGVSDTTTPYFLDGANDSISIGTLSRLMETYNIHVVMAGNWHCRRVWAPNGRHVVQAGTLAPVRFSDQGLEGFGGLVVVDSDAPSVQVYEVAGPRWLVMSFAELEQLVADSAVGNMARFANANPLYINAKVTPEEQELAREVLDMLIQQGVVRNGEVTVMAEVVKQRAGDALKSAATDSSRIAVVQRYLDTVPVPPSLTRDEVKVFVNSCLKGVV